MNTVLLYSSKNWRVTKSIFNKQQTFTNQFLRKMHWPATGTLGKNRAKMHPNMDHKEQVELDQPDIVEAKI